MTGRKEWGFLNYAKKIGVNGITFTDILDRIKGLIRPEDEDTSASIDNSGTPLKLLVGDYATIAAANAEYFALPGTDVKSLNYVDLDADDVWKIPMFQKASRKKAYILGQNTTNVGVVRAGPLEGRATFDGVINVEIECINHNILAGEMIQIITWPALVEILGTDQLLVESVVAATSINCYCRPGIPVTIETSPAGALLYTCDILNVVVGKA